MTPMVDQVNPQQCALSACPEHTHTIERVAKLETSMKNVEISMQSAVNRLDKIRDESMKEFRLMRDDITKGIMRRYPIWVTLGFSFLSGLVCTFAAAYFSK